MFVCCFLEQHHEEKNQNQSCDPQPHPFPDGATGSSCSAVAVFGSSHQQKGVGGTDHLPLSSAGLF